MNIKMLFLAILLITFVPSGLMISKFLPGFIELGHQNGAVSIQDFAMSVEAETLTYSEIADRLYRSAEGEKQMTRGFKNVEKAFYFWLLLLGVCTILQIFLVRLLIKRVRSQVKHNT